MINTFCALIWQSKDVQLRWIEGYRLPIGLDGRVCRCSNLEIDELAEMSWPQRGKQRKGAKRRDIQSVCQMSFSHSIALVPSAIEAIEAPLSYPQVSLKRTTNSPTFTTPSLSCFWKYHEWYSLSRCEHGQVKNMRWNASREDLDSV